MSFTPNQEGVTRLLRFLKNSHTIARQDANNDEVIRLAPLLLRALPRILLQGELNGVTILSSVDRAKPRDLYGQKSYLQSDVTKGTSVVSGVENWLDEEVQPGGTRRSLLEHADSFFADSTNRFPIDDLQPLIRSIRRFADEVLRTQELKDYASRPDV